MTNGPPATGPAPGCPAAGSARRWFFTVHALRRMTEMAVPRGEVLSALNEPEVAYPTRERLMAVRGRLAVVSADDLVVTVLWHTSEIYHRADHTSQPSSSIRATRRRPNPDQPAIRKAA
jgi:hypothetical protein